MDIDALTCLLNTPDLDGSGITTSVAGRACLAALTAMNTRIRRQEAAFAEADPDAYVQAVLSVVPQLMMKHTNVRAIEALILLVSQYSPSCSIFPLIVKGTLYCPVGSTANSRNSIRYGRQDPLSIWGHTEPERIRKLPPRSVKISTCGLCSGPCMPWIKDCRFENVNHR